MSQLTNRFVLRSRRVELPAGQASADVVIQNGIIDSVHPHGAANAETVRDLGDLVLLPGLVDTHVHLNEPGREHWEGFESGSKAARAGGITTLVDMPLNSSPVTTTPAALAAKRDAAKGKIWVDVGFHAGLVPENSADIASLIEAGALAVKVFLCPSGIDEFPPCGEHDLQIAMPGIAQCDVPLLIHAELEHEVAGMNDPRCYRDYLATRPAAFERRAIEMMIRLARQTDCRVHIVHLSDAGCLPMIAQARQSGVRLSVETCPHYLFFESESIADGRTDLKCAPPIRDAANREQLWAGLADGLIEMIVSDHSPCPPEMKHRRSGSWEDASPGPTGSFDQAWGGISSLELGLSIVWSEASRRGFDVSDLVRWMSTRPAALVGLPQGIVAGQAAHLTVFDPEPTWVVDQTKLLHRHAATPYHGLKLRGVVRETYVHGWSSLAAGQPGSRSDRGPEPCGRLL